MNTQFDVIIIGGGVVGPLLALALSETNARIALVDSDANPQGERYIALHDGNVCLLEHYGVWKDLQGGATPIQKVHVSKQGAFGKALLEASDVGLQALGHVVPAGHIQAALFKKIHEGQTISLIQPAIFRSGDLSSNPVRVTVEIGG